MGGKNGPRKERALLKELLLELAHGSPHLQQWALALREEDVPEQEARELQSIVKDLWWSWEASEIVPLGSREAALTNAARDGLREFAKAGAPLQVRDPLRLRHALKRLMLRLRNEARNTNDPSALSEFLYRSSGRSRRPNDAIEEEKDNQHRRIVFLYRSVRRGRCFSEDYIQKCLGIGRTEVRRRTTYSNEEMERLLGLSTSNFRSLYSMRPLVAALNKLRETTGYMDPTLQKVFGLDGAFRGAYLRPGDGGSTAVDLPDMDEEFEKLATKCRKALEE